jgi:hypothetical protein
MMGVQRRITGGRTRWLGQHGQKKKSFHRLVGMGDELINQATLVLKE